MPCKHTDRALRGSSNVERPDMAVDSSCSNEVRTILVPIMGEGFRWARHASVLLILWYGRALRRGVERDRECKVI